MDKKTSDLANKIYSKLKWDSGMPQYLSLREKNAMWAKAVEKAEQQLRK